MTIWGSFWLCASWSLFKINFISIFLFWNSIFSTNNYHTAHDKTGNNATNVRTLLLPKFRRKMVSCGLPLQPHQGRRSAKGILSQFKSSPHTTTPATLQGRARVVATQPDFECCFVYKQNKNTGKLVFKTHNTQCIFHGIWRTGDSHCDFTRTGLDT